MVSVFVLASASSLGPKQLLHQEDSHDHSLPAYHHHGQQCSAKVCHQTQGGLVQGLLQHSSWLGSIQCHS
jgi:hypothetical protein